MTRTLARERAYICKTTMLCLILFTTAAKRYSNCLSLLSSGAA